LREVGIRQRLVAIMAERRWILAPHGSRRAWHMATLDAGLKYLQNEIESHYGRKVVGMM